MNKQSGFSQLYVMGGIALVMVGLTGTLWLYKSWYETEKANVVVEKTIHANFVQQVQHMTATIEKDHAALVAAANASNLEWGSKYNEQIANNNLLWVNNERLRDDQRHRSKGGTTSAPANVAAVDCGNSEEGFAANYNRYRDRINTGLEQLHIDIQENIYRSGDRVREQLAKPRDECIIRTEVTKGWAEDHPAFEHIDPDP